MQRIILSLGMIAFVGALAVGATGAFFSDTETSTANTFTAGDVDLQIDNESYYLGTPSPNTSWELTDLTESEKFFDFGDIKPGDYGEDTISLHVFTNDAYLCANVTLTSDDDNSCTEPENDVDAENGNCNDPGLGEGELADLVNFIWWADDGDNVLEQGEDVISQGPIGALPLGEPYPLTLADSDENIWDTEGPVEGDTPYYIGKAWCFGNLGTDPLPQSDYDSPADDNDGNQEAGEPEDGGITCNGAGIGNESQTDSLTADISFEAVQARHNPDFQCNVPQRACTPEEEFANAYFDVDQGTRKNGTPVAAGRDDPDAILGSPQSLGTPYDNPVVANSFFSLGFKADSVDGGSVVVSFPGTIVDGVGVDLKLWEVTGGSNYPDEKVRIEVANSLAGPWTVVAASVTRDAEIDIAPVASAKYVRITDISPKAEFEDTADGFDLDAVQALNCVAEANN